MGNKTRLRALLPHAALEYHDGFYSQGRINHEFQQWLDGNTAGEVKITSVPREAVCRDEDYEEVVERFGQRGICCNNHDLSGEANSAYKDHNVPRGWWPDYLYYTTFPDEASMIAFKLCWT